MLVAIKICCDKHVSRQAYFCRVKRRVLLRQTRVCRDKKMILVVAPANDRFRLPYLGFLFRWCWFVVVVVFVLLLLFLNAYDLVFVAVCFFFVVYTCILCLQR